MLFLLSLLLVLAAGVCLGLAHAVWNAPLHYCPHGCAFCDDYDRPRP